ncbi:MAG TPA: hypothetical protein PKC30_08815 [Saprospiraceae bacterium]|nr:hypothetical protein [Saprospiraceae bacterium]
MNELIELAGLLYKQKISQIKLITDDDSSAVKLKELYEAILNGNVSSDDEGIEKLYNNDQSKLKNLSRLKNRLKSRLINTLFFIDIENFASSRYEVALHKCTRNYLAVILLLDRNRRKTALQLAEKTLRLAIRFDIVEVVMLLARRLNKHFLLFDFNSRKADYFEQLYTEYQDYYIQEVEADRIYSHFGHLIAARKRNEEAMVKLFNDLLILLPHRNQNKTFMFNFYVFNALYYYFILKQDYKKLLSVSSEAIDFFQAKEGFSKVGIFTFLLQKGYCQLILFKPLEALVSFNKAKEQGPAEGGFNWFGINSLIFTNLLVLKRYNDAFSLLNDNINHKNFDKLPEQYKELWLIKEAYIEFLVRMGKIDHSTLEENGHEKFRLGKFLNKVPYFNKDKRGLNISILIVQMLHLLAEKKYSQFIDRMDALNQYSYRYLRNDDTLRSNAFIKMILKLPDAHYHPEAVKRHTSKFYERMKESPMQLSEYFSDVEIIPYEELWDIVLELLEKNRS